MTLFRRSKYEWKIHELSTHATPLPNYSEQSVCSFDVKKGAYWCCKMGKHHICEHHTYSPLTMCLFSHHYCVVMTWQDRACSRIFLNSSSYLDKWTLCTLFHFAMLYVCYHRDEIDYKYIIPYNSAISNCCICCITFPLAVASPMDPFHVLMVR